MTITLKKKNIENRPSYSKVEHRCGIPTDRKITSLCTPLFLEKTVRNARAKISRETFPAGVKRIIHYWRGLIRQNNDRARTRVPRPRSVITRLPLTAIRPHAFTRTSPSPRDRVEGTCVAFLFAIPVGVLFGDANGK